MAAEANKRALAKRVSNVEAALKAMAEAIDATRKSSGQVHDNAVMLEQLRGRVDQLHLRIDALCSRLDSQDARAESRLLAVDAQLRELPAIIERGLLAALRDVEDD